MELISVIWTLAVTTVVLAGVRTVMGKIKPFLRTTYFLLYKRIFQRLKMILSCQE